MKKEEKRRTISRLKGKRGTISNTMLPYILAIAILTGSFTFANDFISIPALAEGQFTVEGSPDSDGVITWVDGEEGNEPESGVSNDDSLESENDSLAKMAFDSTVQFDYNIINNLALPSAPEFTDVNDDNQVQNRAQFMYDSYVSEMGSSPLTVDDYVYLIKVFNGRKPDDSEFTYDEIGYAISQFSKAVDYVYVPVEQYNAGLTTSGAESEYDGSNKPHPAIFFSLLLDDNCESIQLARLIEYCIQGAINSTTRDEAINYTGIFAVTGFNSILDDGDFGYPRYHAHDTAGGLLFNVVFYFKAAQLMASVGPVSVYLNSGLYGEDEACYSTLDQIVERINRQDCPVTEENTGIFTSAVNGTVDELNMGQGQYTK